MVESWRERRKLYLGLRELLETTKKAFQLLQLHLFRRLIQTFTSIFFCLNFCIIHSFFLSFFPFVLCFNSSTISVPKPGPITLVKINWAYTLSSSSFFYYILRKNNYLFYYSIIIIL